MGVANLPDAVCRPLRDTVHRLTTFLSAEIVRLLPATHTPIVVVVQILVTIAIFAIAVLHDFAVRAPGSPTQSGSSAISKAA